MLDRHGNVVFEEADDGTGGRPEVLRGDLRRILLQSLPTQTVQWGKKLGAVTALGGGEHMLNFTDGSNATSHILVGADGAWSKVRPLLSKATPEYVGTSFVETYLHNADARHAEAAAAVGRGALFALAPAQGIFAHREAGGTLHAYIALNRPLAWFAGIDFNDAAAVKAKLAAEFDGWTPALTALITDGETAPVLRALHALPNEHRWERMPGVTLLGDAANSARRSRHIPMTLRPHSPPTKPQCFRAVRRPLRKHIKPYRSVSTIARLSALSTSSTARTAKTATAPTPTYPSTLPPRDALSVQSI